MGVQSFDRVMDTQVIEGAQSTNESVLSQTLFWTRVQFPTLPPLQMIRSNRIVD